MRRGPEPIGDVLAQLMARRGFAAVRSAAACEAAWRKAVGELPEPVREQAARESHVVAVRRGKLEITVANSTLVQELSFRKPALVKTLAALLPDAKIKDLRFRVASINGNE